MPITFYSKPEALEYIRQQQEDGHLSKLEHLGGSKYQVTLLGTIKDYEASAKGLYRPESGEIVLPHHASTRIRLHELGHKKYGHETGILKMSKLAEQEIEAESFAYEKMGKPVDYRVAIPAIALLVGIFEKTEDEALDIIGEVLKQKEIQFTNVEREKLEHFMDELREK